jgi:hypothetical protein
VGVANVPGVATELTAALAAVPRERIRWIPRHHGAWAMLAVPLLVGVAASQPVPSQVLLAAAALSAYLASAAALDWLRARRRAYAIPAVVFGADLAIAGAVLLVAHPSLLAIAAWLGLATAVAAATAVAGRPRSLVVSLAQVAQALALVPAAALVAGPLDEATVGRATLLAGIYLVGSVFVVRSLIREHGNVAFLAASLAFHGLAIAIAAGLLPPPYVVIAIGLAARAVALPIGQRRLADGPRRVRPIHVGLVEAAASVTVVVAAVVIGF